MVAVASDTIEDADVALWLVDINAPPGDEERAIANSAPAAPASTSCRPWSWASIRAIAGAATLRSPRSASRPTARWSTGCRIRGRTTGLPWRRPSSARWQVRAVRRLLALLRSLLPLGPRYYAEDEVTDLPMRFIAGGIMREKALHLLQARSPTAWRWRWTSFWSRGPT